MTKWQVRIETNGIWPNDKSNELTNVCWRWLKNEKEEEEEKKEETTRKIQTAIEKCH